jgi:hypothetical protein
VRAPAALDALWFPMLGALAAASAVAASSWQRRRPFRSPALLPAAPPDQPDPMDTDMSSAIMPDVAFEILGVLDCFRAPKQRRAVGFTIAVQTNLAASANPTAFRRALTDVIGGATCRAAGGRVLVAAGREDDWVQVSVSDDGAVPDRTDIENALHAAVQLVVRQGGTLDIDLRPGQGTVTTMRLPCDRSH